MGRRRWAHFAALTANLSSPPFQRPAAARVIRLSANLYFPAIGATGFVHGPDQVPRRRWARAWLKYAVVVNTRRDSNDARSRQSLRGTPGECLGPV